MLLLVNAADVDAWTDASQAVYLAPLAHLWRVLAESRVAQWVRDVNRGRGVAPSSSLVYDQMLKYMEGLPPPIRARIVRVRSFNARKLWAVRWRRRWGGAVGTLPLGDVDDPAVLLDKAKPSVQASPPSWERSGVLP